MRPRLSLRDRLYLTLLTIDLCGLLLVLPFVLRHWWQGVDR